MGSKPTFIAIPLAPSVVSQPDHQNHRPLVATTPAMTIRRYIVTTTFPVDFRDRSNSIASPACSNG